MADVSSYLFVLSNPETVTKSGFGWLKSLFLVFRRRARASATVEIVASTIEPGSGTTAVISGIDEITGTPEPLAGIVIVRCGKDYAPRIDWLLALSRLK